MDALIKKSTNLKGTVRVPGSKSYTHRVIAAASLYGSNTLIKDPSNSEANDAMIRVCRELGAQVEWDGKDIKVKGVKGEPHTTSKINVGNSGTAMRIAVALASLAKGKLIITGDPSLQNRPTRPLLTALRGLGVDVTGIVRKDHNGDIDEYAPIIVNATGPFTGGKVEISCKESSQYLTSLLLVSNFAKNDVEIKITDTISSKPYVGMTLEVLRKFGLVIENSSDYMHFKIKSQQQYQKPDVYSIPGDYSQSAFFLAAACLVNSDIRIKGLESDDQQGDKIIVDILRKMGATIEEDGKDLLVKGPFDLHGIDVDLIDAPDLFPVLSVLGIYAKGKMRLYNMPQIRTKETDRIAVIERELTKYGVKVESKHDEMTVYQTDLPENEYVFSAKGDQGVTDHRVAMALSLIGIRSGCSVIKEAHKINISYPDYLSDMESIGVNIDRMESEASSIDVKPKNEIAPNMAL
ncbi:3-phosphoshikimate 1-carboxyvinyltransferase [Nitrosopumilus adriaticus]|uniref:3-phosphoshikimate 1-carboxyvinyltransferase n=1 Tax=Nitrosopumilus adriaticus TaxID=1580092 RepID=UPI00352D5ECF